MPFEALGLSSPHAPLAKPLSALAASASDSGDALPVRPANLTKTHAALGCIPLLAVVGDKPNFRSHGSCCFTLRGIF